MFKKSRILIFLLIVLILLSFNFAIEAKPLFYEPVEEKENYDIIYAYIEYVEGFRYLDPLSAAVLLEKNESAKEMLKYFFK